MKYKFTGETKNYYGVTLRRIQRISDGLVGGWIEKEENLSQYGSCFVYDNARVSGDARVYNNAEVFGNARVYDNAIVYGNARVYGDAEVYGNVRVYGDAEVFDNAIVHGNARVYGNARVSDIEVNNSNQIIYIIGFRYDITVTYAYVQVGCHRYSLDEINETTSKDINEDEIERMKAIIDISLDNILEKL